MIVPKYWAESKTTKKINGRQFTIKRFGWSDVSAADAKEDADARLDEAVKELDAHGTVRRIDHKVPYNGAEGIPIREEVIATHRDVVITRNSYGALCLNTPDVLFADIDRNTETPRLIKNFSIILLSVLALLVGLSVQSWELLLGALVVAVICNPILAHMINKILIAFAGGPEKATMRKIVQMSQKNPELNIRLYRTPLGFRALLMNDLYVPNSDNALRILRELW